MKERRIAFGAPSRYIQGSGERKHLPEHTRVFGRRVYVIIDEYFYQTYAKEYAALYPEGDFAAACYREEITKERIDGFVADAKENQAEVIVGMGGGKSLDTAKAVAGILDLPLVVMPTSASTDAPTSAMSVIYNDRHEHADVYYYRKNPDLVLVDLEILAEAPVRFLISGMGDGLATAYEARATVSSGSPNYINQESGPFYGTITGLGIAELCAMTILEYGVAAKEANEKHQVTDAFAAVVEANTLMSGLGFENVGCAGSHVICNGITDTENGNQALHGEKVAFGVLCQLVAEHAHPEELGRLMEFYEKVGLPLTLEQVFTEPTEENYDIISANTSATEWTREPFPMDDAKVKEVVKKTQAMGTAFLHRKEEKQKSEHRPLILITNDDGIQSEGLLAAIQAAQPLGDVLVVAPHRQQTAMGRAYPRYEDLGIIDRVEISTGTKPEDRVTAYAIHSSPAHAAAYGILEVAPKIFGRKPDLVISGINLGCNLARSINCSGTIGACYEAASQGIPALAMSLETGADDIMSKEGKQQNFQSAKESTQYWAKRILEEGLPRNSCILNVNVPSREIRPEEYQLTHPAKSNYYVLQKPPEDRDWSKPYTMDFTIEVKDSELEADTDLRALCKDRVTSVTPLRWETI